MAAVTSWTVQHWDLNGNLVATLDQLADRKLQFALNGIDQFSGTFYLDDPDAVAVRRLHSIIKVWRNVSDTANSKSYTAPSNAPDFCGVVSSTTKDGQQNTMQFTAMSPFWRLQSRFHLINHYLKTDPDTASAYKQSKLMWKLIDLVNEAFGSASLTGITLGATLSTATDITEAPYFVQRGSNTYQHVFETLMSQADSPDIYPFYFHQSGNPYLMKFGTVQKRGSDVSATTKLQYYTSLNNVQNLSEEESANPDQFANYVWVIGQGGPNAYSVIGSDDYVPHQQDELGPDGTANVGVYMTLKEYPDTKAADILNSLVEHEYNRARLVTRLYSVELAPLNPPYYNTDFVLGDVVRLDADKGALQISNVKQRIYEIDLSMSENNVETCRLTIAHDFDAAVANTE